MVASGTAPMPACSVEPSVTRSATSPPIRADSSSIAVAGANASGSSASTRTSTMSTSSSASPYVHGMRSLTCATTMPPRPRTASMAAGSTLTSVPRDTLPRRGRVVWTSTTSGGMTEAKSVGTNESRDGT